MAKHAKRSTSRLAGGRRRRRVGAMPKINIQSVALQIGGAVVASKLQQMLAKDPTKTMLVNISPFVGLAGGLLLPMVAKQPAIRDLANGMLIQGGISTLKKLAPGLIGNFAMIPIVSGTTNVLRNHPQPVLNGVGYPLPKSSVYRDSMSVVSGIGSMNGSGAASAY